MSNNRKKTIASNSDINIGEKLTEVKNEPKFFAEDGDLIVKAQGKALVQGTSDARISK